MKADVEGAMAEHYRRVISERRGMRSRGSGRTDAGRPDSRGIKKGPTARAPLFG